MRVAGEEASSSPLSLENYLCNTSELFSMVLQLRGSGGGEGQGEEHQPETSFLQ